MLKIFSCISFLFKPPWLLQRIAFLANFKRRTKVYFKDCHCSKMPSRHSFVRLFWYVPILRCTLGTILIFTCKNPPVHDTLNKLSLHRFKPGCTQRTCIRKKNSFLYTEMCLCVNCSNKKATKKKLTQIKM